MGSLLGLRLRISNLNNYRDFQFFFFEPVRLLLNSFLKIRTPCVRKFNVNCSIVTSRKELDEDSLNNNIKKKKKIASDSPKILLEDLNGKLSTLYLEEAERLAKRNGLQLLSLGVTGKRNAYRLIEVKAVLERNSQPQKKDTSKKFLVSTTVSDNDLKIKFAQISKLLNKGKTVVLVLQNNSSSSSLLEKLSTQVQNEFKDKFKVHETNYKNGFRFELSPIEADKNIKEEKKEEERNQSQSESQTKAQ